MDIAKRIENKLLEESKYPRIATILRGNVPTVKSIGIVTAENPMRKTLSNEENNKRNRALRLDIELAGYGYRQIKGKYGTMENPYFITNVPRDTIIQWGKKYEQETVVYGERVESGEYDGFEFHLIEGDKIVAKRRVFVNLDNPDDYYSEYEGRKFTIPFFASEYEGAEFTGGRITRHESELPKSESVQKALHEIREHEQSLNEPGWAEKHYWLRRSMLSRALNQLERILEQETP